MAFFEYKALQANGATAEGSIEAGGRLEAMRLIEERGMTALRVSEIAKPAAKNEKKSLLPAKFRFQSSRVSFDALEDFTHSLSSLLAAAVPLSRALSILSKEATNPVASAKWGELHDLVIDGVSLADAMSRSPEVFPRVYVAMVESGEAGGFLETVLSQIADFQAREKELRAKVLSAMIYPAVVLTMAVCAVIFLMVYFVPKFQTLFADFKASLPAITQFIVGISHAIRSYGILMALAIIGGIYFGRNWLAKDVNRRKWESMVLRLPVVGSLAAQIAMARFCRMLGTLLDAGVPLMNSLKVAQRSLGNRILIDLIADSAERVSKGEPLASALANCRRLFSGSTLEMISVAEESGRLNKELIRLANTTETTLDRRLKVAVTLAEPIMLFLIAAVIGVIFIGMVIPIFSIQDHIK